MDAVSTPVPLRSTSQRVALISSIFLIGFIVYIVFTSIYRFYFHPLAKFPGPVFNAISELSGVAWTLRGRLPMETRKLHDRYGPVVRLSPNELAFNTHQAFQDIYGHREGRKDLEKHIVHVGAVDGIRGAESISMATNDVHARQRKALSYCFSKKALWEQESLVQGYVDRLVEIIDKFARSGEVFDIVKWYTLMTFDLIGDLSFGENFGCLDKGDIHWWPALAYDAIKAGALEQATRRLAAAGSSTQLWLQKLVQGSLRKRRANHLAYTQNTVLKRIDNKETTRKDFIHYILKQAEHYDLSHDEIVVNSGLFIVAGSVTTATALSSLTYNLLRHSAAYEKLKYEIRTTFTNPSEINLEMATNLPYLNACLEEGLRIFPPAPIGFLREVQQGGDTIDGHFVPGGTAVSVSAWCASHSSANFTEPDSFIPERWLDDPKYATDDLLASRPFSLGPRGCIGKDVSWLEMRLALCHLIWLFDFKNADGAVQWDAEGNVKHIRAYSTMYKPPLNITASLRKFES